MSRPSPLLLTLAAGKHPPAGTVIDRALVALASEHRLNGLLWDWSDSGLVGADSDADQLLASTFLASRSWSRRLTTAATELSILASEIGVDLAVFKGIAIEGRWYGSAGLRPAADVDVWVSPQNVDRAGQVLSRIQPDHPLVDTVDALVATKRVRSVDLAWDGVAIDLHFDPFKYGVWYDGLVDVWADVENLDGIRVMGGAAELVNSLLHLNKDRFSRLIGFVDVARMASDPKIARRAWELAGDMGVSVPVSCSAQVVRDTLGIEIDIPSVPPDRRTALWHRLWPEETRLLGNEGYQRMRRRQDWIPLLSDGHTTEALRFLRHVWLPPRVLLDYFNPHVVGLPYPLALWRARTG